MRRFIKLFNRSSALAASAPLLTMPPELEQLDPYSLCGVPVLKKLYSLGQDVANRKIPGDFVECGVCDGGSAAAIALALRDRQPKVWLYDSFEGMPSTKEVDGLEATTYVGTCVGSEQRVREALRLVHCPEENCIIRKGWFENTFHDPLPKTVSILHIDADWYDSVMLSLKTFYDLVTEGGIIILDDFGHWEGCREAFYDFVAQRGIKPLLERFGHSQAFWVKGQAHNRECPQKWDTPYNFGQL